MLIDDEQNDDEITDHDDHEFHTQLELAGEITLGTGSASSDEDVIS